MPLICRYVIAIEIYYDCLDCYLSARWCSIFQKMVIFAGYCQF